MKRIIYIRLVCTLFALFPAMVISQSISITGPSKVCGGASGVGYTAHLNGNQTGGIGAGVYQWTLNGLGIKGASGPSVNILFPSSGSSHTVRVRYFDVLSNTDVTSSKTITSFSVGSISLSQTKVCSGESTTVNASGYSGSNFEWIKRVGNGNWSTVNTLGFPTSLSTGNITQPTSFQLLLHTPSNGGCGILRSNIVTVTADTPPVPPPPSVTNNCGSTILTRSGPPSGYTYYWQSTSYGMSTSNSSTSVTLNGGSKYYLRSRNNSTGCWSAMRTVNYSFKALPATPANIIVANNCGSSKLTRGTPPSGITWYWQSSATGTSQTSSSSSITRTSGNRYYLRGRNNSTGCWGPARSANYNIKPIPPMPASISVGSICGSTVLTRSNPPAGTTWYWQSSASGTSTSKSSASVTLTSGNTYYLRARGNSTLCWGPARVVNYTIKLIPGVPSPASMANNCGNSVLTRYDPPSGITWYWQSSAGGTSTGNSSKTLTRTSGSKYYLRARNNSTGCWGSARTVNYSIKTKPGTPSIPTVSQNCGNTVLTRGNPPSGVTWYWQSSSSGTSTSNSNKTLTRTSGSTYYLRGRHNTSLCWGSSRTVSYSIKTKPSTPGSATIAQNCGNTVLTRGNPPSGVTWYWQGSSSGTSTSNSNKTLTRTSGTTYYLRARHNTTQCWSSSRTVNYSIKQKPGPPGTPTIAQNCGNTVLTRANPPGGITWYWQSSSSGTSTSNSNKTLTRTSGSTYYLRGRHNTSLCWGSSRTVNYSIKAKPSTPGIPAIAQNCGNTVLTRGNPPSGVTWYWQSNSTGTSTSNSNKTLTRSSGTTYYLRARHNTSQCWSSSRTVSYSVKPKPGTPSTPSITQNCGNTVLTRGNPPSGVTWYWQSSSSGTSTGNSNKTLTRTSGSTYYLRARHNSSLCWSSSRTVGYSVKAKPGTPDAPTIAQNCGNTVLTRGTPPSGTTWYWQSSTSGTSTTNSTVSTTRYSGSTYYLRGRNNTTLCWGSARTVSYSIKSVPFVPPVPTANNDCGNTVLTRANPPSGYTYYWQTTSSGTSTSNSNISVTRISGSQYYLRSRNNTTGCWSGAAMINYNINAIPTIPSIVTVNNECGYSVLTRDTPPSGITWYWQSGANGTSTLDNNTATIVNSGSTYYLRARNNLSGCWSSVRSVAYDIIAPPTWYVDIDGDGFAGGTVTECNRPGEGYTQDVLPLTDCDDSDATINPNTPWYGDSDSDGFGDPNEIKNQCTQPAGYVGNNSDRCPDEFGETEGCSATAYEQVTLSNENYVFVTAYQKAVDTPDEVIFNSDVSESITYFDGLGRDKQAIGIRSSPDEKDMVNHITYDELGRQAISYLPYEAQSSTFGQLKTVDVINDINDYYFNKNSGDFTGVNSLEDVNAYSESIFESSPLNRVIEQGAPGVSWKVDPDSDDDHTVKQEFTVNGQEEVLLFGYSTLVEEPYFLIPKGHYDAGELLVKITKNENWIGGLNHTTREYTDKSGRVVLKRLYNNGVAHDTYYVYDLPGNLTHVLPPEAVAEINDTQNPNYIDQEILDRWAFQYQYDEWNRLVEKKLPGADWFYMVYNRKNDLVLSQDGNQRLNNEWSFIKYDIFGRVIYTGIYGDSLSRQGMQEIVYDESDVDYEARTIDFNSFDIEGEGAYYTNDAFPFEELEILTVNYYDDYENLGVFNPANGSGTWEGMTSSGNVKGLPTVSKVKVLETNHWITNATYYDSRGRAWSTLAKNSYHGTVEWVLNKLDFAGNILITRKTHKKDGKTTKSVYTYTYDHANRLLKTTHQLDDGAIVTISSNEHNEIGQLIEKNLHSEDEGMTYFQSIDYSYNIRGWIESINDAELSFDNSHDDRVDFFGIELAYDKYTNKLDPTGLFDGNIGQVKWSSDLAGNQEVFNLSYDPLERLMDAQYETEKNGIQGQNRSKFDVSISYDLQGNILNLTRSNGKPSLLDDLEYEYVGNRLTSIRDNGNRNLGYIQKTGSQNMLTYDANGNLVSDDNREIVDIDYNYMNLVEGIEVEGGARMKYIYDARGNKLAEVRYDADVQLESKTDYHGNINYTDEKLSTISHNEGYFKLDDENNIEYIYNLKDHLGRTRVKFTNKTYIDTLRVTFEEDFITEEIPNFDNYSRVNNDLFDHTDAGNNYSYAQLLNGGDNSIVGLTRKIEVIQGDTVRAKVYGKYFNTTNINSNASSGLLGALLGGFRIPIEQIGENGAFSSFSDLFGAGAFIGSAGNPWDDEAAPKAFLNALYFDKDHNFVSMTYDQIDVNAFQPVGDAQKHDHDEMNVELIIDQPGYVYLYVSNENPTLVEVYFDDLEVTYHRSHIIQKDDYYPFGLSIAETAFQKDNSFYDGSSYANELGYEDLGFRRYDPFSARFFNVDPLAELQLPQSTYQYAANNPVRYVDELGLIPGPGDLFKKIKELFTSKKRKAGDKDAGNRVSFNGASKVGKKKSSRSKKEKKSISESRVGKFFEKIGGLFKAGASGQKGGGTDDSEYDSENDSKDFLKSVSENEGDRRNFKPVNGKMDTDIRRYTRGNTTYIVKNGTTYIESVDKNRNANGEEYAKATLTRELYELYDESKKDDKELYNEIKSRSGIVLAEALHKLRNRKSTLSENISPKQTDYRPGRNKPYGISSVLETIKSGNQNSDTQVDITLDVRIMELDETSDGAEEIWIHGRPHASLTLGGKQIDIEFNFDRAVRLREDDKVLIDTKGEHTDGNFLMTNFWEYGNYKTYKYPVKNDDREFNLRVTVKSEDAYDFEEYMGLEHGDDDKFIDELLPSDLNSSDVEKYKALLVKARSEEGAQTKIIESDWISDQEYTYNGKVYSKNEIVKNDKGKEVKVSELIQRDRQCEEAARKMVDKTGYTGGDFNFVYEMALEHRTKKEMVHDKNGSQLGIKNIFDHMSEGRPVQVGIQYKYKAGYNRDKSTDHFVVLTEMRYDESRQEYYFLYFEPGTYYKNRGTSEGNKLYIINEGGIPKIKSYSGDNHALGIGKKYIVTHVRSNKDANFNEGAAFQKNRDEYAGNCETIVCN